MEPGNATELELLQAKVGAAKSRLNRAQLDLTAVLNLLTELPAALKTGVMRAIETAFEDLGEAEKHLLEMESIVSIRTSGARAAGDSDRCPSCSRPYEDTGAAAVEHRS